MMRTKVALKSLNEVVQYFPKWRIILTLSVYVLFFAFGLVASVLGPTLVHIGYLYHVDVLHTSLALASASTGYTLGSLVCGVLHDRTNKEIQFFLLYLSIGCLSILAPRVPTISGFYAVILFQNTCMGYCETATQPYVVNMWENHRLQSPVVVGLNTVWTLGMFIGPFITGNFLIDVSGNNSSMSLPVGDFFRFASVNSSGNILLAGDGSNSTLSISNGSLQGIETVRIPYLITGMAIAIGSFVFLFIFIYFKYCQVWYVPFTLLRDESKRTPNTPGQKNVKVTRKLTTSLELLILCLSCVFAFFLLMIFSLPNGILCTFAIKGLSWSTMSATWLTSVFSGLQVFGRLAGIPLSFYLKPGMIIVMNSCLSLCGYALLYVAAQNGIEPLTWVSVAICGLAVSTTLPNLLLWIAKHVNLTGTSSSMIFVGGSVGGASGAALTGYMFSAYSHMWFVYICIIASVIEILVFVLLLGILRMKSPKVGVTESSRLCRVNRKYGVGGLLAETST